MNDRHQIQPYPIRMSPDMREKLEAAAKAGNRSLHAEIMMRLEDSFNDPIPISFIRIFDKDAHGEDVVANVEKSYFVQSLRSAQNDISKLLKFLEPSKKPPNI